MANVRMLLSALLLILSSAAVAELTPFEDYEFSEAVYTVDTIKVKPSAGDHYLEGLKATWSASQEIAKKLGHIEDYAIYSSITPESGHFNLMLVTKFKNLAATAPSKAKRDAWLKEMGAAKAKAGNKRALENYPELREITGSYIMNEITFK
ncbi:MAG: hypothetical protein AAGI15_01185 [Pseudomonadota bacterium]